MKNLLCLIGASPLFVRQAMERIGNQEYVAGINSDRFIVVPIQLLVLFVVLYFFAYLFKQWLNYKLTQKMVEKGISEDIIQKLITAEKSDAKNEAAKWFFLLFTAGLGLAALNFFPIGFLSVATLLLSISTGYLVYFLYLKRK